MLQIKKVKKSEKAIEFFLWLCTFFTVIITLSIIFSLSIDTFSFLKEVPLLDFLFGTRWEPLIAPKSFGVLPLVCGTLLVVFGSALISIPIGVATAIYLSEYASERVKNILKPILELLAGIPSVVYGYFALSFITPIIKWFFPQTDVFNAAGAAIVVGVMTLPMVASLCDDAFRGISSSLRQGGYALGATSSEVITSIVLPASSTRILAAFVLALSRAIGETMAVTLAAGATPNLTINPLESIQTMTAYIVQISLGDTPIDGIEYKTSIAVGMLLFLMTFVLNAAAHRVFSRYKMENV